MFHIADKAKEKLNHLLKGEGNKGKLKLAFFQVVKPYHLPASIYFENSIYRIF